MTHSGLIVRCHFVQRELAVFGALVEFAPLLLDCWRVRLDLAKSRHIARLGIFQGSARVDIKLPKLLLDDTTTIVAELFAADRQIDVKQHRPALGKKDKPLGREDIVGHGESGDESSQKCCHYDGE